MYGSPSRVASPFWDVQRTRNDPLVLDVNAHRQIAAEPQFSGMHATGLGTLQSALTSLRDEHGRNALSSPQPARMRATVANTFASSAPMRLNGAGRPVSPMAGNVAELSSRRRDAIKAAFRRIDPSCRNWVTLQEAATGLQHFSTLSAVDQSQVMNALGSGAAAAGGRISFAAFAGYYQALGAGIERDTDFESTLREHWGFSDVSDIMDDMKNKFAMVGLAYAFRNVLDNGGNPELTRDGFHDAIARVGIDYGAKEVQRLFDAFDCQRLELLRFIQHMTSAPRPPTPIAALNPAASFGDMSPAPMAYGNLSPSAVLSSQLQVSVPERLPDGVPPPDVQPVAVDLATASVDQKLSLLPEGDEAPPDDEDEPPAAPAEKLAPGGAAGAMMRAPPEEDGVPPLAPVEKRHLGRQARHRMAPPEDDEPQMAPPEQGDRAAPSYGSYQPPRHHYTHHHYHPHQYHTIQHEANMPHPSANHYAGAVPAAFYGEANMPHPSANHYAGASPAAYYGEAMPPQPSVSAFASAQHAVATMGAAAVAAPAAAGPGRKRAVTIGINYIGMQCQLSGCINDSDTFITLLTENFGYDVSDIRQLRDDHPQRMPTRKNLMAAMKWLVNGAQPGDHLFLHYSGHGTQVNDTDGDELDGKDEALVPCDYQSGGMISDDELRRVLVQPLPEGCRLTVILDCCHSGTAMDLPYKVQISGGNMVDVKKKAPHKMPPPAAGDVVLISGCQDDQTSADAGSGLAGNTKPAGAMTTAFKSVITRKPTASYHKVLEDMRKFLIDNSFTQVPQLSTEKFVDLSSCFMPEAQAVADAHNQATAPVATRPPRRKALTVGINYLSLPSGQGRLSGCINDSETIIGMLKDTFGFKDSEICRLRDDRANMMPTRENLLASLRWLTAEAQPGDELFFHYSGHGGQVQDTDGDEASGKDDTLIPCDFQSAGQITDDDLHAHVVAPLPKGVKMWVILDCCHSGTALDLPYKVQVAKRSNKVRLRKTSGRPRAGLAQVLMLSGCKDTQTSADVQAGAMGAQKAAGAMTTALRHSVSADVSCHELLIRMRDYLGRNGYKQVPQMSSELFINLESPFVGYSSAVADNPNRGLTFAPPGVPAKAMPFSPTPQRAVMQGADEANMNSRLQHLEMEIAQLRQQSQSPLGGRQAQSPMMHPASPMLHASMSAPHLPVPGGGRPWQVGY